MTTNSLLLITVIACAAFGSAAGCEENSDSQTDDEVDTSLFEGACLTTNSTRICNAYFDSALDAATLESNCENSGGTYLPAGCPTEGCVSRCTSDGGAIVSYFYAAEDMDQATCEAVNGDFTSPCS